MTDKEGCTRRIISLGENPGLKLVQQGQHESKDSFTAKLQEIDRDICKFEGKKRGIDPVDSELHNNMHLNLIVFSLGFSNLEGKAGGVESSHELPKYVGLDGISVKVSRPSTIGLRLGKTNLSLNGLDVGQFESLYQDPITKPIHLSASQEVQGRKWTRLDRLAHVTTNQNISLAKPVKDLYLKLQKLNP